MTKWISAFTTLLAWSLPLSSAAIDDDSLLCKVIVERNIRPLPTRSADKDAKFLLGQALFFDPILSGNRDVACATCHLWSRGTSDGLPVSIGTGGKGLGEKRVLDTLPIEHPRNSLDLWNRDNNSVTSLFWDGRVEVLSPNAAAFRSPLGDILPAGMENVLAVQALFPLARPDEMLGRVGDRSPTDLPDWHANQPNELVPTSSYSNEPQRLRAVHTAIRKRLLGSDDEDRIDWQEEYRRLFRLAYPDRDIEGMTIAHVANAIAHFEEVAFATRETPWDTYVGGDQSAIGQRAKAGAVVFFGKGRCAVCHSGPLFSDFAFHSLGIRQAGPGVGMTGRDYGRYYVTGDERDKYKFRTPPLRNVTLTAPYFHTGTARTLREAIAQHVDPLYMADKYEESGVFAMTVEEIGAVSYVVAGGIPLREAEVDDVIEFLKTLEDLPGETRDQIIPESVPSGLPISVIIEDQDSKRSLVPDAAESRDN